jgi:lipopolysaccharide export system permease protein
VYVRDILDGVWQGVFIYRELEDAVHVIVAERGERMQDASTSEIMFRLYDGRLYEGQPGNPRWLIVGFEEHNLPIRFGEDEEFVENVEIKPTSALLGSSDAEDQAELQWRIAAPVSLLILALLAIPLSRSSPREGRYARVGAALLIYFIYANTLSIARVWVERGEVPAWLGLWWVHAALGAFAVYMLVRDSGVLRRPQPIAAAAG